MSENAGNKKSSKGCGFGCLIMLAVAGLIFAAFIALVFFGMISGGFNSEQLSCALMREGAKARGEDEFPSMIERWSTGTGTAKVVRVPVDGMIMLHPSPWGGRSAVTALRSIRRATHDKSVEALILDINSGGGGITASDIIYKALLDFKAAQPERKIVVLMGDVAASGAYYISLPADYILANPTTVTGSIGVIMQSYNLTGLAEKIGVSDVTVKSGRNKDFFNPLHAVDPEQMAIMQRLISSMHERFVNLIVENRKLSKEVVEQLADGRVYLADEAVENGLIDGVGYYRDAERKVAELLGKPDGVKVYRYQEHVTLSDLLGSGGPGIGIKLDKLIEGEHNHSGLMYLWKPAGM